MVIGFPGTNFASVKPSKSQAQTNLNLITASGSIYSFTLTEGFVEQPDLKIFVELKDGALPTDTKPRFVPASAIEDYRTQVDLARMQATEAKKAAAEELATKTAQLNAEVSKLKAEMPQSMRHDYAFKDAQPFNVEAAWNDGKFTYIRANPSEVPALYEVKDGKENLVEYRFDRDLYVAPKVMDNFWLRIGKKRLDFERKGS